MPRGRGGEDRIRTWRWLCNILDVLWAISVEVKWKAFRGTLSCVFMRNKNLANHKSSAHPGNECRNVLPWVRLLSQHSSPAPFNLGSSCRNFREIDRVICCATMAAIFRVLVSHPALGIKLSSTELNLEELWKQGDYKKCFVWFHRGCVGAALPSNGWEILGRQIIIVGIIGVAV